MRRFIIHNKSAVFGGQERYAQDLVEGLLARGMAVEFRGTPKDLVQGSSSVKAPISAEIMNGNSALYRHSLRRRDVDLRVYVQHSSINDGQDVRWKRWVRKLLIRVLLRQVDLVIRVCNAALPDNYARGKIVTIYNGVRLPPAVEPLALEDSVRLLMVGAVNDNKNQRLGIDLLRRLKDATLTVVGDGPLKNELRQYANSVGVGDRVDWVGFAKDVREHYRNAHALLMLSKYEAFPYAVLESMSYGRPVVAVPVGGVPEIIVNERNGWLLQDYTLEGLIAKIKEIRADELRYQAVSLEARATVASQYTVDHMVDQLLEEINKRLPR